MENIVVGKGRVFVGSPAATHKVEISTDDFKFIGYASDIELKTENEYEDIYSDYSSYPYKAMTNQKTTVNMQLQQVDNHLYTILTGFEKPQRPVDKIKRLVRGR